MNANRHALSTALSLGIPLIATQTLADGIYWTELDWGEVQRTDLDGSNFVLLLDNNDLIGRPFDVALDLVNGNMYVTDSNAIFSANLDGTDVAVTLTVSGLFSGLAVDPGGGHLYWCDFVNDRILRADLDGANVIDLVASLDRPEFVTLDQDGNKLYWTDRGSGKIQRANLDGTGVEDLVTGVGFISGIDLDVTSGHMYWAASINGVIHRAGMAIPDGETPSTRTDIVDLLIGLAGPIDLELDLGRSHIYWVSQNDLMIRRADLDGSNVTDIAVTDDGVPNGLALELTAACLPDLNNDRDVEAFDLAILLGQWGPCDDPCEPGDPATTCAADLSGDCVVEAFDLALLLGAWGPCA